MTLFDMFVQLFLLKWFFTGTLIAGAQADHNCAIGLILGTGCNACYLEKVSRLPNWTAGGDKIGEVRIVLEISIDYRCDNRHFWLSAHNCQVPTPTSQNLELEQHILIFGAY